MDGEQREQLLRSAVRELRDHLIKERDQDSVPAARESWNGAVGLTTALMQTHGIPLEEPQPEQADITPALIERLLDEAELSPGPMTPGARAMVAIFRWLYVRAPTDEATVAFDRWAQRAAQLYDGGSGSGVVSGIAPPPGTESAPAPAPAPASPPAPAPAPASPTPPAAEA